MSDLIDRQAAIDMFQNLAYDDWNQGTSTTWADAFAECAGMIVDLPSAQPEPIKINIEDFNKEDWERFKKEWGNTPITVLPAQPTDADIQKMQDIEQAMLEKAYECGKQDAALWIPCSERMPSEPFGCIVTVWDSTPTGEGDDFENILPYFVGWDGEQWNDEDGEQCPFEVIAWMPRPKPYKGANDDLCRNK